MTPWVGEPPIGRKRLIGNSGKTLLHQSLSDNRVILGERGDNLNKLDRGTRAEAVCRRR